MEELDEYIRTHEVDVVVLTVPQAVAQDTANHLMELGIRGFWNFTNVELSSADPEVKFENIHFADSLLTLSYRIANR
jgi:redox-sensing transcriptional repressor